MYVSVHTTKHFSLSLFIRIDLRERRKQWIACILFLFHLLSLYKWLRGARCRVADKEEEGRHPSLDISYIEATLPSSHPQDRGKKILLGQQQQQLSPTFSLNPINPHTKCSGGWHFSHQENNNNNKSGSTGDMRKRQKRFITLYIYIWERGERGG